MDIYEKYGINEKTGKPRRLRAEIVIWKNEKVLLTINKWQDNVWYGLPGGGVEVDEDSLESVKREALEEVGISVIDVKLTKFYSVTYSFKSTKEGRAENYSGKISKLYEGRYNKIDKSILGVDGDAVPYEWFDVPAAYRILSDRYKVYKDAGSHQMEYMKSKLSSLSW